MKIFVSWSGPLSKRIAEILREWLPDVLQQVEPFISTEDIRKGNRWQSEIAEQLNDTSHGIACLTESNLSSDWMLFETGALSKVLENSMTWTLLIGGLKQEQVTGPLAQFQHTYLNNRSDFKKLVEDINETMDAPLPQERLDRVFQQWWPILEERVQNAVEMEVGDAKEGPERSERDLLRELIDLTRETSRKVNQISNRRVTPPPNFTGMNEPIGQALRGYKLSRTDVFFDTESVTRKARENFLQGLSIADNLGIEKIIWSDQRDGTTKASIFTKAALDANDFDTLTSHAREVGLDFLYLRD